MERRRIEAETKRRLLAYVIVAAMAAMIFDVDTHRRSAMANRGALPAGY
jgi:hypothetical protein